jgi:hypothetical protein
MFFLELLKELLIVLLFFAVFTILMFLTTACFLPIVTHFSGDPNIMGLSYDIWQVFGFILGICTSAWWMCYKGPEMLNREINCN